MAFKCELCRNLFDEYGRHAWSCRHMGGCRTIDHTGVSTGMLAETS